MSMSRWTRPGTNWRETSTRGAQPSRKSPAAVSSRLGVLPATTTIASARSRGSSTTRACAGRAQQGAVGEDGQAREREQGDQRDPDRAPGHRRDPARRARFQKLWAAPPRTVR